MGLPDNRSTFSWLGKVKKEFGKEVCERVVRQKHLNGTTVASKNGGVDGFRGWLTAAIQGEHEEAQKPESGWLPPEQRILK